MFENFLYMKNRTFLFITLSLIFSIASSQNSWYVSENGDNNTGEGSQANPWATITKAMGENMVLDNDTIHINGTITEDGDFEWGIQVMKDLIFKGESKETSIIQAASSKAFADRRVFTIWDVADVRMINLCIRNGYFDAYSFQYGAGILNWGSLSLENCLITDNSCDNEFFGGGIYNQFGTLIISNTYIYSNYAYSGGAGLYCEGGIIDIENSSFALNFCQQNLAAGGAISITDNTTASITNCTFYYNLMGLNAFGAGIYIKADDGNIIVDILNSTIADNEAGTESEGIGIFIENETSNTVDLSLKNCIISNSSSNNYAESGSGSININRSYTLCRDASLPNGSINGNIDNSDPMIDSFMDHGGLTPTCALQMTSPAINTGTDAGAPLTDQRGMSRFLTTDMGSYEYQVNMGLTASQRERLNIFPNPAKHFINIELNHTENQAVYISIFNLTGKRVALIKPTVKTTQVQVDISDLPTGIYYIKAETEKRMIAYGRFVK